MNNIAVDVIASFNPVGDIKPVYIRLENEDYQVETHKIEKILQIKKIKHSGIDALEFTCSIYLKENTLEKNICLKYFIQSHKWLLLKT